MPLILHAAWLRFADAESGNRLFLWAEDIDRSYRPDNAIPTLNSREYGGAQPSNGRNRAPKVPSHPHQASIVQLRSLLASEFVLLDAGQMQPSNATVWLPSVDGAPLSRRNVSGEIVASTAAESGSFAARPSETGSGNGYGAPRGPARSNEARTDEALANERRGQQAQGTVTGRSPRGEGAYATRSSRGAEFDTQVSAGTAVHAQAGEGPLLAQWQVTGLALPAMLALRFLSHLARTPAQGAVRASQYRVRPGNDLLFWSNVAKFAVELMVGEHYLPALQMQDAGTVVAKWLPQTLDARVENRRLQLIDSMPPVCRAYNLDDPDSAGYPAEVVDSFIGTMIDVAIREWTADGEAAKSLPATNDAPIVWLRSLLGRTPQVALPPQPVHELYQEWRQWTERLYLVRDANIQICFVLEEPAMREDTAGAQQDDASAEELDFVAEPSTWRLRYYLQARDNPDLMVPASEVWTATHGYVMAGGRQIDQPQERILTGLGVASRFFSPIERSLRSPQPEQCMLSTEEAYRFLREIGPLLESSGFGVVLPEWWHSQRSMRLGLRLRMQTGDDFANDDLERLADDRFPGKGGRAAGPRRRNVDYSWELTLGGEQLSREQFDQLFAMKTPLLRLHERWVELDPEQVSAAQRFLTEPNQIGAMSLLDAVQIAQRYQEGGKRHEAEQGGEPGLEGIPEELVPSSVAGALGLEEVVLSGWVEDVLVRLRSAAPLTVIDEPAGFVGELRPYQRRGLGWLVYLRNLGLGACLADDMGLGKTIQTIALLLEVRRTSEGEGGILPPALLICPTSVVANWRREMERFAPSLNVMVHHGHTRSTGADFIDALDSTDLVVTSYGTARRDVELLTQIEWSDLILDEAQNIKTPTAKQTLAVQQLRGYNRIALTGTPVENRLSELWSIMRFLNPEYIGSRESFRRNYVVPIERYNDEERTDELRRIVQPFLLRRLKSNPDIISDLPAKNEMIVYCSLSTEQAALYAKTANDSLNLINGSEGIQRRGQVLALLTRLKQIANHPAQFLKESGPLPGRSGKLARLTEMLDEALSVGDSALIFTQYVEMGRLLQAHLTETLGFDTLFLHGGTSAMQRDKMVQNFQREDGPPIFVLSLRAGGSGLNLTRANHVFHYDRWWNPAVENQATDRAFRIGQVRNVQVHKFVAAGTLEESIHELIESKQALAESIVGSGEEWLTELDTDQLRDLITLRHDAIEGDSL